MHARSPAVNVYETVVCDPNKSPARPSSTTSFRGRGLHCQAVTGETRPLGVGRSMAFVFDSDRPRRN